MITVCIQIAFIIWLISLQKVTSMKNFLSLFATTAILFGFPQSLMANETVDDKKPKQENPSGLEDRSPQVKEENPSGLEDLSPEAEQEIQDNQAHDPFEKQNPYEAYDPFTPKTKPKTPAEIQKEEDDKQRRRDKSRYLSDENTLRQNEKRNEDKNRYHMRVPEKPDRYQKYDRDKD